jgi:hypothetical protein
MAQDRCASVLIPSEEQTRSDYSMLQAYMMVSAAEEYDRLRTLSREKRSAEASYKLFSAEFDQSNSKEDFKERIERRLSRESLNHSVSDAKAIHRRHLSDIQLAKWGECISTESAGGSTIVAPREVSSESFVARVEWIPQRGVGAGNLSITLDGGTIDGRAKLTQVLNGRSSVSYIVRSDPGADGVRVVVNIASNSDSIRVPLRQAPTKHVGMLGDRLTVARRYPTPTTPYWTPSQVTTTVVAGSSDTVRLAYDSQPNATAISANPESSSILFNLVTATAYEAGGSTFDGYVVSGFTNDIRSVDIEENRTGIQVSATHTRREVRISLAGRHSANAQFVLRVNFDK